MKKRWLLVSLIICTLGLTGCTNALPLTQEEEGMVAEFMAKELLESQEGYTQTLIEPTEVPEPTKEASHEGTVTTAPTETTTPTVAPTSVSSNDDSSNEYANADFAQVMGMSDIDVEYIGYERVQSISDSSFNLQSKEGEEFLIVKFDVKNTSKKELLFNLSDLDISYQLDINAEDKLKPLVTLKENDLRFIDLKLKANGTKETVLMFEIDKDLKIENANLIISREDKTAIIKLK